MNKKLEATLIILTLSLVIGFTRTDQFLSGALLGAYVGFAGLPFFDSQKWQPQPILCGLLGAVAAVALFFGEAEDVQMIILAGFTGGILGLLAPFWAKYM